VNASSRLVIILVAALTCVAVTGSVRIAAGGGAVEAAEPRSVPAYTFGADVSVARQDEIRGVVEATRSWLRAEAGVELPALRVAASADRDMLLQLYGRGGPVPDRDRKLLDQWFASGGAITSGLDIFLYTNDRWNGLDRAERDFIVAHEVFHTFEYGLGAKGGDAIPGPIWLVEGAAEYVAARVVASRGYSTIESYRADYEGRAQALAQTLRDLESYGRGSVAWGGRPQYTLGFLAADRLVGRSGLAPFLGVWKAMGAGASFDGAFVAEFGEPLGQFYAGFDAARGAR